MPVAEEGTRSIYDHDIFDWFEVPDECQVMPSKVLLTTKFSKDCKPARFKTIISVVQGFNQLGTKAYRAALPASLEPVRAAIANAVRNGFRWRMLDIKPTFPQTRMGKDDPPGRVMPPKGLQCSEAARDEVWYAYLDSTAYAPPLVGGTNIHKFSRVISSTTDHFVYGMDGQYERHSSSSRRRNPFDWQRQDEN